jgi:pre-mRNA-processing factor 40
MNGINGHTAPPGLWQEARNADGRVYYYNTITKATQWNKPEELMTPAEVSFSFHPLKKGGCVLGGANIGISAR